MKVFQNIELVQVNLDDGTGRFYFPENTRLFDRVINEISFFTAPLDALNQPLSINSPFDGRTLIGADKLENFYVEVVRDNKTVLHTKVSARLSDITLSSRISVNSKIDQTLTNLTYVGDLSDLSGKCILCYFTFDNIINPDYEPADKQRGVQLSVTASNTRLSELIDYYIQNQGDTVKCIEAVFDNKVADNHFYLDLRDTAGRTFRLVPGERMRYTSVPPKGGNNQYQKCYLADYNIDFKNSYLVRASSSGTLNVTLIFTY